MKIFILLVTAFTLVSCNTTIGLYRDTKQGFLWTKDKINNARNSSGSQSYDQGAPVY